MATTEQKTISPKEALALLEESLSYYMPEEAAQPAAKAEEEPVYIPYAA
ncbi:hypothetical protein KM176_13090 [Pseudooceanicola sp. CBS1P-1]|uniref:Uncharacterized protein n=1 Tax=Pseudooceanicola albus TaxID=2692189 RepID=A0A6L7G3W9_9RHOB|nr:MULTISPECIES: hypothetical protein [Pseudooceanicola]MBT9384798.1 hypothetical protein [Pseudooceanicola endophyticus]MXN18207.1 hypothetical protein [Pseudooceanicola albus]